MLIVLEEIKQEHYGVRLMLNILKKMVLRLEAGEEIEQRHLDDVLLYIQTFVETVHHKKEEEIFYPVLEDTGDSSQMEILEIDLGEHELSRNLAKGINESSKRFFAGDKEGVVNLVRYLNDYISLTKMHADREDEVIFNLVDETISDVLRDELSKKYRDTEQRIGFSAEQQFLTMLTDLEKIYS